MLDTRAQITNGVLPVQVARDFTRAMRELNGRIAHIVIEPAKKTRSIPQNRFYFGEVITIVQDWLRGIGINFDKTETHEFIVRHIWKHTEVVHINGIPYERRLSSTKLTTKEWEDCIEQVRIYGADKGFEIPFPKEAQRGNQTHL